VHFDYQCLEYLRIVRSHTKHPLFQRNPPARGNARHVTD
jgi:hypothetical protein